MLGAKIMELMETKKIGVRSYHFTATGKNVLECVLELQKNSFPNIPECGLCGSTNLELTARTPGKFKYCGVRCNSCGGDVTFGRRQDDPDTFFVRRGTDGRPLWRPYEKNRDESDETQPEGAY